MATHVLILLIGGNPLPNFVTAKYLMQTDRPDKEFLPVPNHLVFLHSNATASFARKLVHKLSVSDCHTLGNLGENERNRHGIVDALLNRLNELSDIRSIHLNYTGGRKPMAVHAYLTASRFADPKGTIAKIFSYLDPDTFRLVRDDTCSMYPDHSRGDLRSQVVLPLKDLFDLHLMTHKRASDKPLFDLSQVDIEEFTKDLLYDIYEHSSFWVKKFFNDIKRNFEIARKKKRNLKLYPKESTDVGAFKILGIEDLNNIGFFKGIGCSFPSLNNFFEHDRFKNESDQFGFTKLIDFMTGGWLEDLVFLTLQKLFNEKRITYSDLHKSVEAVYNKRDCEMDVIALRGYEMVLFSCSTANIGLMKSKAFEALFRAEQLGGDHARAVIVSILPNSSLKGFDQNNLSELEKDLQSFDARQRAELIGCDDLYPQRQLEDKLIAILSIRGE